MASNEYSTMAELIKDYYDAPVGTYLNQTVTINEVSLACDIYRVTAETVLTSSIFTGCTAVDANTQIIIGKNMSVESSTTLTPPYRCKGIVIGDVGTFTNAGTISMTARGASGAGKNIQLTNDYMISAVGGAGASSETKTIQYNNTGFDGASGSSPTSGILSCGGGGSGAVSGNAGTRYTGAGGRGTSFSGGAGGGGSTSGVGQAGSSTGGAGGNGQGAGSRGGAGNPKGNDATVVSPDSNGTGTGGLIVIIADSLVSSGNLTSQGSTAPGFTNASVSRSDNAGGGASGGGCIVLISRIRNITGSSSVAGGSKSSVSGTWIVRGGAGGAGVYASYIVDDLILVNLPVEIAITDKAHKDNIDPSEAVRVLGMMDEDELYYDIMGTRHRASQGHYIEDSEGTQVTRRDKLAVQSPLTVEDDSTNEKTVIGADTSGSLDFTQIVAPGTAGQVEGHIYSTEETVVGKWIDGKPIYEKTIVTTMPSVTTDYTTADRFIDIGASVDLGFVNNAFFISNGISFNFDVYAMGNSTTLKNGLVTVFSNSAISNNNKLRIRSNSTSWNSLDVTVIIRYTKTTDTV